ncbi:MAG: FadR/GntR family transcriptional regulator [Rhizobacter sp.]
MARILGMRIVGGEYQPGDVLPVEADLCTALNVSRTTVREGVKQLSSKRLIEISPKTGTRVLPFADWNLLDRDVLAWRLAAQFDTKIVQDIFEMRLCVEPRASALAAQHGTEEGFRAIERRYQEVRDTLQQGGDMRLAAQADLEFHMTIINMSQNGMFITLGGAIKAALRVSSEMLHRLPDPPMRQLTLYEEVQRSILAREGDAASRSMTALLQASRDRLLSMMIGLGRRG